MAMVSVLIKASPRDRGQTIFCGQPDQFERRDREHPWINDQASVGPAAKASIAALMPATSLTGIVTSCKPNDCALAAIGSR